MANIKQIALLGATLIPDLGISLVKKQFTRKNYK